MSNADWKATAQALNAALNADGDDGGVARAILTALGTLGMSYDRDVENYNRLAANPPVANANNNQYNEWLVNLQKQFVFCAGIVASTGGTPPTFNTNTIPFVIGLMQTAMTTAIAALAGDPQAAATGAIAALVAQYGNQQQPAWQPPPFVPVPPAFPGALAQAIARAAAYTAFLKSV